MCPTSGLKTATLYPKGEQGYRPSKFGQGASPFLPPNAARPLVFGPLILGGRGWYAICPCRAQLPHTRGGSPVIFVPIARRRSAFGTFRFSRTARSTSNASLRGRYHRWAHPWCTFPESLVELRPLLLGVTPALFDFPSNLKIDFHPGVSYQKERSDPDADFTTPAPTPGAHSLRVSRWWANSFMGLPQGSVPKTAFGTFCSFVRHKEHEQCITSGSLPQVGPTLVPIP